MSSIRNWTSDLQLQLQWQILCTMNRKKKAYWWSDDYAKRSPRPVAADRIYGGTSPVIFLNFRFHGPSWSRRQTETCNNGWGKDERVVELEKAVDKLWNGDRECNGEWENQLETQWNHQVVAKLGPWHPSWRHLTAPEWLFKAKGS